MVSCPGQCLKIIRMFDFFQSSKLLRYNGDAEYKSTTGGCTTVAVVAILIALFYSMGLRTIRKEIIFSSTESVNELEPSGMDVTLGPNGDMMFSVSILGLNLSSVPRLFDIKVG